MKFTKMHGCGNDYIYVNGFTENLPDKDKPDIVRRLSDRHFGIGGDGVIFINPVKETDCGADTKADFEMEMFNADGTRSEMCGNGIRCVAKYVYDKGLTDSEHISIISAGMVKYLDLTVEGKSGTSRGFVSKVRVNMGNPILIPEQIPVVAEGEMALDEPINVNGREYKMTCVSMGNPHAVVFMKDVKQLDIEEIGPLFENHERFPKRTNTEFVEIIDRQNVFMRVWERGTGETLACGTGCCAVAVACVLGGLTENKINVKLLGGELTIEWDRERNLVFMTGPAETVFEGSVDIDV